MEAEYRDLRPLISEEYESILNLVKQGFTYRQIVERVKEQSGSSIKTCHIALVKRESGIGTRRAWNTGKRYSVRQR